VIEETDDSETPVVERQYLYGNGIDEVLILYAKEEESFTPYYYLSDRQWTLEALVDEDASIVEAYAYRAYADPTIKTGHGGHNDWFEGRCPLP